MCTSSKALLRFFTLICLLIVWAGAEQSGSSGAEQTTNHYNTIHAAEGNSRNIHFDDEAIVQLAWTMLCSTLRFRMDVSISIIQAQPRPRRCPLPLIILHMSCLRCVTEVQDHVWDVTLWQYVCTPERTPRVSPNVFLRKVPLGRVRVRQLVMGGLHPPWVGYD